jgi:hypothetical protein
LTESKLFPVLTGWIRLLARDKLNPVPRYRIHRLKDSQKEHFRWSAHTGGLAIVKPRDYEMGGEAESHSPYSLWKELQEADSKHAERPLSAGDLLEIVESEGQGRLLITKYIGFEPAQWFVPEVKVMSEGQAVPQPEGALQG